MPDRVVGSEWPPVIWRAMKLLSVVWVIEGESMVSIQLLTLRDILILTWGVGEYIEYIFGD